MIKLEFRRFPVAMVRGWWPISYTERHAENPDGFRAPDGLIRDSDQLRVLPGILRDRLHYSDNKLGCAEVPAKYPRTFGYLADTYPQRAKGNVAPPPPQSPSQPGPDGAEPEQNAGTTDAQYPGSCWRAERAHGSNWREEDENSEWRYGW